MDFLKLNRRAQENALAELEAMPDFLTEVFASLPASDVLAPGPQGSFCPVEHAWHLADLEQEGFASRIDRLRAESRPHLPDFDGDRIARERDYKSRRLADGIAAFRAARLDNVATLRALEPDEWRRQGEQEGIGPVSLGDIPASMAAHDAAHRQEIQEWLDFRRRRAG